MADISVGRNKERYYEVDVADGKESTKLTKSQKSDIAQVGHGGAKGAKAEENLAKSGITVKTINKEEYNDKVLTHRSDALNAMGTDDKKLGNFLKSSHTGLVKSGDKTYEVLPDKGRPLKKSDYALVEKAINGDVGAKADVDKKGIKYKELTGGASQKASDFLAKHSRKV